LKYLISITLFVVVCGLGFVNLYIFSHGEFSSKKIGFSNIVRDLNQLGVSPLLGVK
jgi:hypothetical protein